MKSVVTRVTTLTDNMSKIVSKKDYSVFKDKNDTEPEYVKLYVKTLLSFYDLPTNLNKILIGFLRYMTYVGEGIFGGQIIFSNKAMKEEIAREAGVGLERVNQALTQFVRGEILHRINTSTYQVNPSMFGKGDWKDILKVREAYFNFVTGSVEAVIEYKSDQS